METYNKTSAIYVIPRSIITIQNVFEISYISYEAQNVIDKSKYCYFRYVHDGEDILQLLRGRLKFATISDKNDELIVCLEFDHLKKILDMTINGDDKIYQLVNDFKNNKDGCNDLEPIPYEDAVIPIDEIYRRL